VPDHGRFEIVEGRFAALFRYQRHLYFRLDDALILLDNAVTATLRAAPDGRRTLTLRRGPDVLLTWCYRPNEYEEDVLDWDWKSEPHMHDIGLLTAVVLDDEYNRRVYYQDRVDDPAILESGLRWSQLR
jgi:hypothetical protein